MRDKASGGKNIGISQHEWEIFFKDMPQPAVILDPEHDIIAANNAALKIIGNKEAYVLKDVSNFFMEPTISQRDVRSKQ